MGGLDRQGIIVSGSKEEIEKTVNEELSEVSHPFVLGADCTLPGEIPWLNIRTAIAAAHAYSEELIRKRGKTCPGLIDSVLKRVIPETAQNK